MIIKNESSQRLKYNTTSPTFNHTSVANLTLSVDFITSRYVLIFLTLASFYLVIALGLYTWKNGKRRKVPKVNHLPLISAVLLLFVCLVKLGALWNFGLTCAANQWISSVFYGASMSLIYTTLWARQRKLYSDKLSGYKVNKLIKVLSAIVIVVIYMFFIAVCLSSIFFSTYQTKDFPCIIEWGPEPTKYILGFVSGFIPTCFIFQFLLFLLIAKPLLHKQGVTVCSIVCYTTYSRDIHKLIVRLGLCAIICVLSSVMVTIVLLLNALNLMKVHDSSFVVLNVTVNILATVYTFVDWKKRLFPFGYFESPYKGSHRISYQSTSSRFVAEIFISS